MQTEALFLNSIAFEFPTEPKTFYFSLTDREDVLLTKLSHQLFPNNIRDVFPNLTNGDTLYTSFTRELEGFTLLEINFADENFSLIKRYINREIKYYFTSRDILVEPTFIKDNQIWLRNTYEKVPVNCQSYDKFTVKVNFNHFTNTPELVLSYDRKARVYKKSVTAFLAEEEGSTADLFNRVVYVEYFQNGKKKTTKRSVTKFKFLKKNENVDYKNVYPIIGKKLATFFDFDDDEEEPSNPFQRKNRYTKYLGKISGFYVKFMNNPAFRKVVHISENGFDKAKPLQIGKTATQSKQLVFGKKNGINVVDVIPQRGVNSGPFRQPNHNNIQMFFIVPDEHKLHTNDLSVYLIRGYKNLFKGLKHYTDVPVSMAAKGFNISFTNTTNPLPEIEEAIENKPWVQGVKYLAIYLTPIGKHAKNKEQRKIYYKVKEKLLNLDISSQCIETDKMMKILEDDAIPYKNGNTKNNFAYTLQNMAIAINAKLGGIPWRINTTDQKELVVGVGAFRNEDTNVQYIGSAFSFDNTGAFNSFEYFHHDQTAELAGSIEEAIIRYANVNDKPSRLIIHFYKEISEEEIKPIENALHNLGLDIPVYVVTINKTESEDFVVFDTSWGDLMPYSGRYINLGNKTYLLCNNTRYEDNSFKALDGFPFPVKLKIECPSDSTRQIDTNTIKQLIDQVYQFSRIYWKSVKQQNLPVTIKYPEMVAQIAPHFNGGNIPPNIGNDNLWFL
ncbi:MAG: Piwi domain-containing protein [Bacteroidota bacterium]|nr:Piwi domain-containing protein [Bacteroidota bacterium]